MSRRTNKIRTKSHRPTPKKRSAEGFIKTGKFFSTSGGGIFFETDRAGELKTEKYYIDETDTKGAMQGDTVRVKLLQRRNDARVIDITERAVKAVIGTIYADERYDGEYYVEPDDGKLRFTVGVVGINKGLTVHDGDKVEIKITVYPNRADAEPLGTVTRVFGDGQSRGANYEAILHENEIITEFSQKALEEADICSLDTPVPDGRDDFRGKTVFTIDGEDAKDLDDAISVRKKGDSFLLGVHIADVSHYVRQGSALDSEAMQRGTSVYFSDKVVPMLPKALSNGICSLNAHVDRYTLSAVIELDKFGEIKNVRPCKGIINSRVRGVYTEVNALLSGDASAEIKEKYACITEDGTLEAAYELYNILKKKSRARGALELETPEGKVILDESGEPVDIVCRERGEAEMLIEQFMLCANEAIAGFMTKKGLPCIYRVHEKPDPEKLMSFIKFAHNLRLQPPYCKKENINAGYFGSILARASKQGMGYPVSYMLLRTMQKAKYSEENAGHFGLSSPCYCHFTSPIRRYPDLAVHRMLSAFLETDGATVKKTYSSFAHKAAKSSSDTELKALQAEREIDDLYKTVYMGKHIGEEYEATVSSVTSFGLFCMLPNTCEGLVLLSSMKNRYIFDPDGATLSCREKTYRLGDKVKIKVQKADVSTRKVDFVLVDEPEPISFTEARQERKRGRYHSL